MKKLVKEFFLKGLIAGGFGPIVYALVMFILYLCKVDANVNGLDIFKNIISIYLMAFIIGGISVIWKIEKISLAFLILIHGGVLYLLYLITYLINGWLETN